MLRLLVAFLLAVTAPPYASASLALFTSGSGGTPPEKKGGRCAGLAKLSTKGLPEKHLPKHRSVLVDDTNKNVLTNEHQDREMGHRYDFSSCAIVGNGGVLKTNTWGKAIDSHTAVFRANQAPIKSYEKLTGRTVTFRVLNKKWLQQYGRKTGWLPLEPGVTLITSRGDRGLVRKLYAAYANDKRAHVATMALSVGSAARGLLSEFRQRLKCATRRQMHGGNTPSSGIFQVAMALALCDRTTVYGFGNGAGAYQYYKFHSTERSSGDIVHSFDTERALISQLGKDGYLTLCEARSKGGMHCGCPEGKQCGGTSPGSARAARPASRSGGGGGGGGGGGDGGGGRVMRTSPVPKNPLSPKADVDVGSMDADELRAMLEFTQSSRQKRAEAGGDAPAGKRAWDALGK